MVIEEEENSARWWASTIDAFIRVYCLSKVLYLTFVAEISCFAPNEEIKKKTRFVKIPRTQWTLCTETKCDKTPCKKDFSFTCPAMPSSFTGYLLKFYVLQCAVTRCDVRS